MATEQLIALLQKQLKQQQEESEERLRQQKEATERQLKCQQEATGKQEVAAREQIRLLKEQNDSVIQSLTAMLRKQETDSAASRPSFQAFDSTTELWSDYWPRFVTFLESNSCPVEKAASVFLNSQTPVSYKLLSNLAAQQSHPVEVNQLSLDKIEEFMKEQFSPKRFIVRERFKFWSDIKRRPGESVQELASRIRQAAITCDFPSIKNPLDEAMRTRFICSIGNEAVLKSFFKHKDGELTFAKANQLALENEDAAKVAKETVFGTPTAGDVH